MLQKLKKALTITNFATRQSDLSVLLRTARSLLSAANTQRKIKGGDNSAEINTQQIQRAVQNY